MKTAKDMIHQEISIDDIVVYNPPYSKGIVYAYVVAMSKSGKTLETKRISEHGFDYGVRVTNVIKITEQMKLAMSTNPEEFI